MKWLNEETLEFLRLYEHEPVIWNREDAMNNNRIAVTEAWQRIQNSFSLDCSILELKKKKESLMAIFRPILIKVKTSMKKGSGADEVYKPNWFAYNTMAKFLGGIYESKVSISSQDSEDATILNGSEDEIDDGCETKKSTITFNPTSERVIRKRRASVMNTIQNRKDDTYYIKPNMFENTAKDEYSLYAELLATKLRKFDEKTCNILMHEIDNLIFKTQMQNETGHYEH